MGATYLFVVALAARVLNESFDFWRLSGSGMIAVGPALLAVANE